MSDANFQNNNSINYFLVKTKTTEYGQVEANQHDVISPFHGERKVSTGS